MTSRRQARRQAFFLVYQWDLSGAPVGSQYAARSTRGAHPREETIAGAGLGRRADHPGSTGGRQTGWARSSGARCASRSASSTGRGAAEVAIDEAIAYHQALRLRPGARLVNGILGGLQRTGAVGS